MPEMLGLRAIERETSHLPATAPKINAGLGNIANGLKQVDTTLGGLHPAAEVVYSFMRCRQGQCTRGASIVPR